jgi:hypothetical protein
MTEGKSAVPTDGRPVEFTEDRVPSAGIEGNIEELVELYGGTLTSSETRARAFILPLRRGVSASGGVECTVSWVPEAETVTLRCNRDVDAPKVQRILLLSIGVIGALLFMVWPFLGKGSGPGALAWVGGAVALAVWFLTMRRTSGGIAYDFLRRLADRQRVVTEGE